MRAETQDSEAQTSKSGAYLRIGILAGFVILVIAMLVFGGSYVSQLEAFVIERARDWSSWVANNAFLYALIFVGLYTTISVLGLPVSVIFSLGGGAIAALAFGFWPGAFLSAFLVWISVVAGSWGLFEFVKRFGAASFESLIGPYVEGFRKGFEQDQFFYMLASRFTPVPPVVMTVVPALLGAGRVPFLAAAALGFIPGVFVYAMLGATLGNLLRDAVAGAEISFASVVGPEVFWALLGLFALSIVPIIVRRLTRKG